MKKLISLVAVALLSVTALFAAEHTFHVGLPVSYVTGYDSGSDNNGLGAGFFYFDYVKVHDSKFSFKADAAIGASYTSTGCGFGFSPIANEKMTLSLFGDFGFGNPDFIKFGADAMFTYRFTNHIGAFADIGTYTDAPFVAKLGAAFTIHTRGE